MLNQTFFAAVKSDPEGAREHLPLEDLGHLVQRAREAREKEGRLRGVANTFGAPHQPQYMFNPPPPPTDAPATYADRQRSTRSRYRSSNTRRRGYDDDSDNSEYGGGPGWPVEVGDPVYDDDTDFNPVKLDPTNPGGYNFLFLADCIRLVNLRRKDFREFQAQTQDLTQEVRFFSLYQNFDRS